MSITKSVFLQPTLLGGSAERLLLAASFPFLSLAGERTVWQVGSPSLAHWMGFWNRLQLSRHQNPSHLSRLAATFSNTGVLKLHHPSIPMTNPALRVSAFGKDCFLHE